MSVTVCRECGATEQGTYDIELSPGVTVRACNQCGATNSTIEMPEDEGDR